MQVSVDRKYGIFLLILSKTQITLKKEMKDAWELKAWGEINRHKNIFLTQFDNVT